MSNNPRQTQSKDKKEKKAVIPAKLLTINEISAEMCRGAPPEAVGKYISSVVENKTQIHHNMECPKEVQVEGKYNLVFPMVMTSALYEKTSPNRTKSYIFYLEVYGAWADAYTSVCTEVDELMKSVPLDAKPDALRLILLAKLKALRPLGKVTDEEIDAAIKDNVQRGDVLNISVAGQVATRVLMKSHLDNDATGCAIMQFAATQEKIYADWMDANPEMKYKILGDIGVPETEWDTPTRKYIEPLVQWETHPGNHPTLKNKINYEKSPGIAFKAMCSVPKKDTYVPKKKIIVDDQGSVMWSTIYDFANNPFATEPISTYDELQRLTYRSGDSAAGFKQLFRLQSKITVCEPTCWWSGATKRCIIQLRFTELKVAKQIPVIGKGRALSMNAVQAFMLEAQQSAAQFGITTAPTMQQARQQQQHQQQGVDQSGLPSWFDNIGAGGEDDGRGDGGGGGGEGEENTTRKRDGSVVSEKDPVEDSPNKKKIRFGDD